MKPKFTGTKKPCLKCNNTFLLSEFYKVKKTGIYSSYCKKCYSDLRRDSLSLSYKNRANSLFNSAKHGSKKRGIIFKISKENDESIVECLDSDAKPAVRTIQITNATNSNEKADKEEKTNIG